MATQHERQGRRVSADVAGFLKRIPGWSGAAYEPLGGGTMNRSWRVTDGDRRAVLKLDAGPREKPYNSRAEEADAQREAQAAGLAAEVLWHSEQGILTEWLDGESLSRRDLTQPPMLDSIAAALRCLHALPALGHVYDPRAWGAHYAERLRLLNAPPGADVDAALELLRETRLPGPAVPCHNDPVAGNLVARRPPGSEAVTVIGFIDWEYAGNNSALFDLAGLIAEHELNPEQRRRLTSAYFGPNTVPDADIDSAIAVYRALVLLWEATRAATTGSAAP
ncbi:MAG: choline/ethanolamine kinase family protein [Pseudomonadota bacterium]